MCKNRMRNSRIIKLFSGILTILLVAFLLLPFYTTYAATKITLPGGAKTSNIDAWYDTDWTQRAKVTFNNAAQAENLLNFPVKVELTGINFSFSSANTTGEDIRFTDSDGTTLLPYEKVSWETVVTPTWTNTTLVFSGVYVNPLNGDIWAGGMDNGKIYRSIDGGQNWTQKFTIPGIGTGAGTKASGDYLKYKTIGVWVDSHGYVYVSGDNYTPNVYAGVYRSIDNGENWTKVLNMHTYGHAWFFAESTVTGTIIIGEGGSNPDWENEHEARIWRSTDNGGTFTEAFYDGATGARHVHGVWYDQYNGYFYASLGETHHGAVMRSTDDGLSWTKTKVGTDVALFQPTSFMAYDGYRIWGEDAVAGGAAIIKTINDVDFVDVYAPAAPFQGDFFWMSKDLEGNTFAGVTNGEYWATSKSSIVVSSDGGNTWSVAKDLGGLGTQFGGSIWGSNVSPSGYIYYSDRTAWSGSAFTYSSTGSAIFYVKVPQINASSATDYIWMYYGNDAVSTTSSPEDVWTDYMGVYHLEEAAGLAQDSSGHNDSTSENGTITKGTAGKIGDGYDIPTQASVFVADSASTVFTTNITASLWVNPHNSNGALSQALLSKYLASTTNREWQITKTNAVGKLYVLFGDPANGTYEGNVETTGVVLVDSTWVQVGFTFASGTVVFYVNGVSVAKTDTTVPVSIYNSTAPITIGEDPDWLTPFNGLLDEVRIESSHARSALWMKAMYLSDTNAFVTVDMTSGLPVVTTSAATSITSSTAIGHGEITDIGYASVDEKGFEWGTTTGTYTGSTTMSGVFGTGTYSLEMTGITSNSTIYYRAKAHNVQGWGYGAELTFVTSSAPVMVTGAAVDISSTTATMQGSLASIGSAASVFCYFEYGTDTLYGSSTVDQTKTSISSYSQIVTDLSPNTTYHYRAVGRYNTISYVYGTDTTFTTLSGSIPFPPTNLRVSNYTSTTTTLVWSRATGTNTTLIRWSITNYPASPTEGTQLYNSTGTTTTQSTQTAGTRYYYSAWSVTDGNYSATYATTTSVPSADVLSTPDIFQIESVQVYRNYADGVIGDQLIVFSSQILWTEGTPSTFNASDFFYVQVLDGSTIIKQDRLKMWGYVPNSLYISNTTPLTWNKAYTFRIIGTGKYSSPPSVTYTLTGANYIGSDWNNLANWVLDLARRMQDSIYWDTLLESSQSNTILNSAGSQIFDTGIPGLSFRCSNLFYPEAIADTYVKPTKSMDYSASLVADAPKKFGSAAWTGLLGASAFIGTDIDVTTTLVFFLLYLLAVAWVIRQGAHTSNAMIYCYPLIIIGAWMGGVGIAIPVAIAIVVSVLFVLKKVVFSGG